MWSTIPIFCCAEDKLQGLMHTREAWCQLKASTTAHVLKFKLDRLLLKS